MSEKEVTDGDMASTPQPCGQVGAAAAAPSSNIASIWRSIASNRAISAALKRLKICRSSASALGTIAL